MSLAPRHLLALLCLVALATSCADCASSKPKDAPVAPSAAARPYQRPPVIDVHTHIGPDAYETAIEVADQNGLGRIVNLSGGHQGRGLELHLEAIKRHPGRIAVFYNLAWRAYDHPDFGQVMSQGLEEAVLQGYAGLKVSKALGLGVRDKQGRLVAVDDPRLDPIWATAGRLGVPVAIHTGDPKAFFEPIDQHNERIEELTAAPHWSFADPSYPRREELLAQRDNLLRRHRSTTFILVHFGNNPEDLDYVESLLEDHPNVVLDVAARLAEVGRHDPARVRRLFLKYKDRILFGTDLGIHHKRRPKAGEPPYSLFLGSLSKAPPTMQDIKPFYQKHWRFFEAQPEQAGLIPHPVPIQGPWKIRPIGLPPEVLQAVYHDNAARLIFKDPDL